MTARTEIVPTVVTGEAERVEGAEDALPKVGSWHWIKHAKPDKGQSPRWLGCVVHVGSNYVEFHGAGPVEYVRRVHADDLAKVCEPAPEAAEYIARRVEKKRQDVARLMGEVQEITARLAISTGPALPAGSETQALALRDSGESFDAYKRALAKAKEKTLPALFEEIEKANKSMAKWMTASLIPLKAEAAALRPAMKAIESRIFNVELYAGLVETIEQVKDGEPAPMGTKVHLFQRRCYMDEECLADYRAGGMEFKNLREFDAWLTEPANVTRLLPFPRCIVAFQVRRHDKEREVSSFRQWVDVVLGGLKEADKLTFLYMRNGEQIFRLNTAIEFGSTLFPDLDRAELAAGKVYGVMFGDHVNEIVTEGEYKGRKRKWERAKAKAEADYQKAMAEWNKLTPEEKKDRSKPWKSMHYDSAFDSFDRYERYSPDSVYYDDISAAIRAEIERHNRLVLVLQGLFDRSPVFHPHPPLRLWEEAGFAAALDLVYDESRALTTGEAPDFEAYRAKLNASLKAGSITVGQEDVWERVEAERENERQSRSWRSRNDFTHTRFRPYGNPGPGTLARTVKVTKAGAHYRWTRERQGRSRFDPWTGKRDTSRLPCTLTAPLASLLNVDAYTPGDFKIFFADPRTRADYLKWAPLLLEAEEYHAGNREVREAEDDDQTPVEPKERE